jgi:hypothetical protein
MTVSPKKATDPKGWIKEDGPNLEKKNNYKWLQVDNWEKVL